MPTSPRERAHDACPGVLRTHPAADGALARLRIPGGSLGGGTARTLAACARDVSDGCLELTSRGNVQLRGLADGAAAVLAARAAAAGLLPSATHERVRNIVGSPLSGRAGGGLRDIAPLVDALDAGLCADPELAALPGRMLFAVDDGSGDLAALPADLALRALPAGETLLLVAGEPVALRVPDDTAVPALLAAARAFLDVRATGGAAAAAWRVAELPIGRDHLLDAAAAASRSAAGTTRDGVPSTRIAVASAGFEGAAGAGTAPVGAWPGAHAQRDGRWALTALVPLGRLHADQLDLLAAVAEGGGDGQVIVTPWRSVVLRDLNLAVLAGASDRLAAAGLVVDRESGWVGVTSCAGRPGCAKALADVRRDASRSAGAGSAPVRSGTPGGGPQHRRDRRPVHWSGCTRRCGQPAGEVVEVVADAAGYRIHGGSGAALAVPWSDGDEPGELSAADWDVLVDAVAARRSVARPRCRDGREAGSWR
ncbi:nitrite reductase [Frankia tisae]|uniref:nitrite reductase n=1 Tax=Frankia tisae TaxID=2950104 RepID=UPI0021C1EC13|nr:nitrite reductase [Frankia tisae]